jgi:DNA-binding NtrC family response regulator
VSLSYSTPVVSEAPSAGAPTVLLVAGEGRVTTYPVARGRLVIGRASDCDVRIAHAALSRHHAELVIGAAIGVRDLGSTNGTRVLGELRRAGAAIALPVGESFHIGPFSLVVLDHAAGAPASSSSGERLRVDDPSPAGVPAVVDEIARSSVSVLLLGETGVGKEVLAQTLHARSLRRGPLQRVNCASLTASLVEAELFGHDKGAFTGAVADRPGLLEAARGGTVFLDEIGELSEALQAKLLRAVEAREVIRIGGARPIAIDVRFIAATHRDLAADVAAGRFRRDLFYRLDGVSLRIPPLRERPDRIPELARQFAAAAQSGRAPALSHAVLAKLQAHAWPGNVRELKAVVERAVLLAGAGELRPSHVMLAAAPVEPVVAFPITDAQAADRAAILAALDACAGNQTRAARHLGVARSTLATKLALYRIPRPRVK